MANVNIDELSKRSEELMALITETNTTLGLPQSHVREDFQNYISTSGAKNAVAFQLSKAVSSGKPEQAIIVGGILAVAYVGAAGIDLVKNTSAKNKARQALMGYYQELVAKNGLLIKAQQDIIEELNHKQTKTFSEVQALKARLNEVTAIIARMADLRGKVEVGT